MQLFSPAVWGLLREVRAKDVCKFFKWKCLAGIKYDFIAFAERINLVTMYCAWTFVNYDIQPGHQQNSKWLKPLAEKGNFNQLCLRQMIFFVTHRFKIGTLNFRHLLALRLSVTFTCQICQNRPGCNNKTTIRWLSS